MAERIAEYDRGYEGGRRRCARYGQWQKYKGEMARQIAVDCGTLTVQRAYYVCGACGQMSYPLDEKPGLVEGKEQGRLREKLEAGEEGEGVRSCRNTRRGTTKAKARELSCKKKDLTLFLATRHPMTAGGSDPEARLKDMDAMGVDQAFLYPTWFAEGFHLIENPDIAYWTETMDADLERLAALVYEIGQSGTVGEKGRFVYL